MVSFRELAALPKLAKGKVVAGSTGQDRLVRWVHFLDLPDVLPWVQGGELLIITGMGLQGDMQKLIALVQGVIQKQLAGLIINVGPYIPAIPQEVLVLADQAGFPILELPWDVKLVEVMQEASSYIVLRQTEQRSVSDFFEQLLLQKASDKDSLVRRADTYGYDLSKPLQAVVIQPSNLSAYLAAPEMQEEADLVLLKTRLEQYVRDFFSLQHRKILLTWWMNAIVMLLPWERQFAQKNTDLVEELVRKLNGRYLNLDIVASLGSGVEKLEMVHCSYRQACKLLWLAESTAATRPVYAYEQLGLYKLLLEIEPEKLEEYYQEVIGPLNEYDRIYKMDLVGSLFAYFEENGNVVRTAKRLFLHRNTLDYRLKKVEEATGKSMNDPYDRLTLQLGVIVGRQLKHNRLHEGV